MIEMITFFSILLAFGIYQLVTVNRSLRDDEQQAQQRSGKQIASDRR